MFELKGCGWSIFRPYVLKWVGEARYGWRLADYPNTTSCLFLAPYPNQKYKLQNNGGQELNSTIFPCLLVRCLEVTRGIPSWFFSSSSLRLAVASSGFVWHRRASEIMFPSSDPPELEYQHCLPESLWDRGYELGSARNSAGTYYRKVFKDDRVRRAVFLTAERPSSTLYRPVTRPPRKTAHLTGHTWPPSGLRRSLTILWDTWVRSCCTFCSFTNVPNILTLPAIFQLHGISIWTGLENRDSVTCGGAGILVQDCSEKVTENAQLT